MPNSLELLLRRAEKTLRERQVCTYWKIPNDLRLTHDEVVFGERGPCDFLGHTTDGRALLIEAKMSRLPRLRVPHKRGILGHQWMALRDADAAGAVALIAWMNSEINEVVVLPFARARELRGSRRSIPWTGGASLEGLDANETPLVIVDALIDVIQTKAHSV